MSLFPGVNYTIVMDGASGPNLAIGVVPNPVFTSINMDDLNQLIGSVRIIRINVGDMIAIAVIEVMFCDPLCQGMNIKSVNVLSEIVVTVGGGRCTIDLGITTDTVRILHNLVPRPKPLLYISPGLVLSSSSKPLYSVH